MKALGIILVVLALAGCAATGNELQTNLIETLAFDAGYIAYRAIPEARVSVTTICALTEITDQATLAAMLKAYLGEVWTAAANMTSTDAQMLVMGLNNLWGVLNLTVPLPDLGKMRIVVKKICAGVDLAAK